MRPFKGSTGFRRGPAGRSYFPEFLSPFWPVSNGMAKGRNWERELTEVVGSSQGAPGSDAVCSALAWIDPSRQTGAINVPLPAFLIRCEFRSANSTGWVKPKTASRGQSAGRRLRVVASLQPVPAEGASEKPLYPCTQRGSTPAGGS